MHEITTTINHHGQITLPLAVQRLLGVGPRDQVSFVIDHGEVRLVPTRFTLATALGSVEPATRTADFKAIIEAAKEERAGKVTPKFE
jgi:bifunctional DNA-binding transcriptional regulator/antitoxin component of YhaV-PrlF toxin-antitoxin module